MSELYMSMQCTVLLLHRDLPSLDTHCKPNCWYCKNRCINCFGSATAEHSQKVIDGTAMKFCSEDCLRFYPKPDSDIDTKMYVITADGKLFASGSESTIFPSLLINQRCAPISKGHAKLLHIFITAESVTGYPVEMEMALCIAEASEDIPNKSMYVVQCSRSAQQQYFLEFYVTDELAPKEPLQYLKNNATAKQSVEKLRNSGTVQSCLQRATLYMYTETTSTQDEHQSLKKEAKIVNQDKIYFEVPLSENTSPTSCVSSDQVTSAAHSEKEKYESCDQKPLDNQDEKYISSKETTDDSEAHELAEDRS